MDQRLGPGREYMWPTRYLSLRLAILWGLVGRWVSGRWFQVDARGLQLLGDESLPVLQHPVTRVWEIFTVAALALHSFTSLQISLCCRCLLGYRIRGSQYDISNRYT